MRSMLSQLCLLANVLMILYKCVANKAKYLPGCLQVCQHHKIEWKEDWFEGEYALNHITVQNWTSRYMSLTMEYWWAILPSWVVPNPCRQIANSVSPGLQCQLCQFHFILWTAWVLSKLPKMNIFTGSHCLGWFCTLSVIIIIIISNSALYKKKQRYCASELHSYFWRGRWAFFKSLWQIPKSN